jgi:uncharacterized membrane protein
MRRFNIYEGHIKEAFRGDSRLPPSLALAAALALQVLLPDAFEIVPRWILPTLEALLFVPLLIVNPTRLTRQSRESRLASLLLIALVNAANFSSVGLLVHGLLHNLKVNGTTLILAAITIYVTNVLVFSLWYWELDGGGPVARLATDSRNRDWIFPQMATPSFTREDWRPSFVDYLYLSFTDSTAFSPTDAMPVTPIAKMLMLAEATAALLTVTVVASRAVGILG